jgi:hypothetical protein
MYNNKYIIYGILRREVIVYGVSTALLVYFINKILLYRISVFYPYARWLSG